MIHLSPSQPTRTNKSTPLIHPSLQHRMHNYSSTLTRIYIQLPVDNYPSRISHAFVRSSIQCLHLSISGRIASVYSLYVHHSHLFIPPTFVYPAFVVYPSCIRQAPVHIYSSQLHLFIRRSQFIHCASIHIYPYGPIHICSTNTCIAWHPHLFIRPPLPIPIYPSALLHTSLDVPHLFINIDNYPFVSPHSVSISTTHGNCLRFRFIHQLCFESAMNKMCVLFMRTFSPYLLFSNHCYIYQQIPITSHPYAMFST